VGGRTERSGTATRISTQEGKKFVRLFLSLTVGVAVGLAPFLGNFPVPGFVPLLSMFPRSLRGTLIPLSAFLMGIIAAMVQYYSFRVHVQKVFDLVFKRAAIVLMVSFALLVVSYFFMVVQVPLPGRLPDESVIIGLARLETCQCKDASELRCVEELSLSPASIEGCWGSLQINTNKLILTILYLATTGSFGAIIGLLVLRGVPTGARARRKVKKSATRESHRPGIDKTASGQGGGSE